MKVEKKEKGIEKVQMQSNKYRETSTLIHTN